MGSKHPSCVEPMPAHTSRTNSKLPEMYWLMRCSKSTTSCVQKGYEESGVSAKQCVAGTAMVSKLSNAFHNVPLVSCTLASKEAASYRWQFLAPLLHVHPVLHDQLGRFKQLSLADSAVSISVHQCLHVRMTHICV